MTPNREQVIKGLECHQIDKVHRINCSDCPYHCDEFMNRLNELHKDAIALLKEQEAVVKQWTKEIADNQFAHAPNDPHEFMSLDEHLENEYKRGIWDGLQIAWNIISEGR